MEEAMISGEIAYLSIYLGVQGSRQICEEWLQAICYNKVQ